MSDALSILAAHFNNLKSTKVDVPILPFPLFFKPLTGEQAFKLSRASNDRNPKTQAKAYAELIVETVTTEDGAQAFPMVKGGPDPVKTLTTGVNPRSFTALCNALLDSLNTEAAAELEKK